MAKENTELKIGTKMADGTIYLGLYNEKDWFVAAEDAKDSNGKNLAPEFNAAVEYAKNLKAHGHDDWMLPPGKNDQKEPDILNEMFNNRSIGAFKGTYNEGDSWRDNSSWYWSSTKSDDPDDRVEVQQFGEGIRDRYLMYAPVSVRAVRVVSRGFRAPAGSIFP